VPILAGAAVILGGVGVALALRGGAKAVDTSARADTAPRVAVIPARDTTAPPAPAPVPASPPPRRVAKQPIRAKPRIDVSRAQELLDNMLLYQLAPKTAPWIRDSAADLFSAPGISPRDKAYAAFVYGMALVQMNDRAHGCEWIRKAAMMEPADTNYQKIVAQCER
jgi:hypothetical protein